MHAVNFFARLFMLYLLVSNMDWEGFMCRVFSLKYLWACLSKYRIRYTNTELIFCMIIVLAVSWGVCVRLPQPLPGRDQPFPLHSHDRGGFQEIILHCTHGEYIPLLLSIAVLAVSWGVCVRFTQPLPGRDQPVPLHPHDRGGIQEWLSLQDVNNNISYQSTANNIMDSHEFLYIWCRYTVVYTVYPSNIDLINQKLLNQAEGVKQQNFG